MTTDKRPTARRAKIVCTIGPACNTEAVLRDLMRLGMDVARLNFSHGTHEEHAKVIDGDDVECEVVNGGELREHQGIHLPGLALRVPALTEKDRKDLEFGITHGVDMVALSFVRTANDVLEAKKLIGNRSDDLPVIAKLEKPQAIEHLDEILEVADG